MIFVIEIGGVYTLIPIELCMNIDVYQGEYVANDMLGFMTTSYAWVRDNQSALRKKVCGYPKIVMG